MCFTPEIVWAKAARRCGAWQVAFWIPLSIRPFCAARLRVQDVSFARPCILLTPCTHVTSGLNRPYALCPFQAAMQEFC